MTPDELDLRWDAVIGDLEGLGEQQNLGFCDTMCFVDKPI
jgi:hypothetical protein